MERLLLISDWNTGAAQAWLQLIHLILATHWSGSVCRIRIFCFFPIKVVRSWISKACVYSCQLVMSSPNIWWMVDSRDSLPGVCKPIRSLLLTLDSFSVSWPGWFSQASSGLVRTVLVGRSFVWTIKLVSCSPCLCVQENGMNNLYSLPNGSCVLTNDKWVSVLPLRDRFVRFVMPIVVTKQHTTLPWLWWFFAMFQRCQLPVSDLIFLWCVHMEWKWRCHEIICPVTTRLMGYVWPKTIRKIAYVSPFLLLGWSNFLNNPY